MEKDHLSRPVTLGHWRYYLSAALILGLPTLWMVFKEPSSAKAVFLGFSFERLVLSTGVLLLWNWLAWQLALSWRRPAQVQGWLNQLNALLGRPILWGTTFSFAAMIFLAGCFSISLIGEVSEPFSRAILERLLPVLLWLSGIALMTLVGQLALRRERCARLNGRLFPLVLASFIMILLAWSWAAVNVYPQESLVVGWNKQGTPILEHQVLLAWLCGMGMLAFITTSQQKATRLAWLQKVQHLDLWIALLFWLLSAVLWLSIPLPPSWFVSEPAAPNYEHYPTSDARYYDAAAQTALIGGGYKFFNTPYIRRPLHALYLTVLHVIAGQDYDKIVFIQILLLATFPALIYLFTKTIHTRVAGVIAGVLVMLREANSIAISGNITASHSKVLLVDLPTAVLAILFTYVCVLWLSQDDYKNILPLVCGGIMGMSLLVRFETLVFTAPLLVVLMLKLAPGRKFGVLTRQMLVFGLGIILVLAPWIVRNWQMTGQFFIDSPSFRSDLIGQRFRPVTPTAIPPTSEPGATVTSQATPPPNSQSPEATASPTPTPVVIQPLEIAAAKALEFAAADPTHLAGFIMTHWLNNQLQTVLVLPSIFRGMDSSINGLGHRSFERWLQECCSLRDYIRRAPYWRNWNGQFLNQSILPLLVNLLLLAYGLQAGWNRKKWINFLPMLFSLSYTSLNAIFRNSGGRYLLPVDWGVIVYFSIGLAQVSTNYLNFAFHLAPIGDLPQSSSRSLSPKTHKIPPRQAQLFAWIGIFLCIGAAIPIVEKSFPQLYPETRINAMLADALSSPTLSPARRQDLQTFIDQGGLVNFGRALYPQLLPGDPPNSAKRNTPLPLRPYPRLEFTLVTPSGTSDLHLPGLKKLTSLPNGADIAVFTCPDAQVLAVVIFNSEQQVERLLMRSPAPQTLQCPLR